MSDDPNHKPAPPTERIGKYEILDHIATGGMGIVYKARDLDLDRVVALKILPPEMAKQKTTLVRFGREARAAARLRHENIVTLFDVGEDNGTHFIALEFIEGTDLQDYINRQCRLDPEEARLIMIQATRALVHAHEHSIVHRDIKPSNFLLMKTDKGFLVKLTDFGLAMRHENDAEFRITRDKTTVGTVDYMSPEQARDSRSADIRSDIYSLGCTAFHMLAGTAPFARGTLPERIVQHMQAPPPDVRKLNKSVPAYLVAIINRMLAKKPEDRYQTPGDLLADLEHPARVALPVKLEKDKARKQKNDPTTVIEKKEFDEPDVEKAPMAQPRSPKAAREKKSAEKKVTEHVDDWVESAGADETVTKRKSRKKDEATPMWMYAAGGSVGVLVVIVVMVLTFGSRPPPPKIEPPPRIEPPPMVIVPPKVEPPPVIDTSPSKMTVVARTLPSLYPSIEKANRAALRKEYYGPFASFPTAPATATVLRVSRLADPGPTSFRRLEDAVARAKPDAFTVIEIDDDGPLFVPALSPLAQRSILVRATDNHRPLLVWDAPKKNLDAKTPPTFLSLKGGQLILENLDFVMQVAPEMPSVVFDLPETDFYARDCTFSIAGKTSSTGVTLVRRIEAMKAEKGSQTWLQRVYLRGPDATLLDLQGASTQVLIEDSLIAGQVQPLIRIRGRLDDTIDLYCVRSTLVSGQNFLRWEPIDRKGDSPALRGWMLDTIISRDDRTSAQGDMIHLADGADSERMRWRAANSVYGGWKQLLAGAGKSIGGGDDDAWHRHWTYSEGDRTIVDTWPSSPPAGLEETPASVFLPGYSRVAFASATGPGALGCTIGWLPPTPKRGWVERAFDQRSAPAIPVGRLEPPTIETGGDAFYHGERLDLNKVDLGAHLNTILQTKTSAPRIVMHLHGRGVCQTSPLRIKGVQELVLFAEPSKDLKDPFTLEINMPNLANPVPAIDMTGGRLELIGLRVRLDPFSLVPTVVQMQDGDLTLSRCWLQGPLSKANDSLHSLITMRNVDSRPTTLLLRDNVLLSNKLLVHLHDHVQLRARNNLGVSLGDAFLLETNRSTAPLVHVFDRNTLAARHHIFILRAGPEFYAAGQVLLQANANAFLAPFADSGENRALLRGDDAWIGRGAWSWQGRYNVYDARLHAYLAALGRPAHKQSLRDWQLTWGQAGEFEAQTFDFGPTVKAIVDGPGPNAVLSQLDRLALPASVRGEPGQAPPGANIWGLGIAKKKG